jgi:signal transduction histidine kinase
MAAADSIVSEVLSGSRPTVVSSEGHTAQLVHALAARDPRFLTSDPDRAMEAQLIVLHLLGPLTHASLWLGKGRNDCLVRLGSSPSAKELERVVAQALSARKRGAAVGGALRAVPVEPTTARRAALVVRARKGQVRRVVAMSEVTASALASILERRLLLDDTLRTGQRLLDAAERRIARIGFDIHDGPLQALALMAGELASLRRDVSALPDADEPVRRLAALEELTARLERELRELSLTAGISGLPPLREQLERDVEHFRRWSGVDAHLKVRGNVDRTTRSQRIAVHRIVEEALTNVREHSKAREVKISLYRGNGSLHLEIADDGRGFDVDRALRRAGRDGRLGLGSMAERARLLGGRFEISSRQGGPTVIWTTLPAWDPLGVVVDGGV